MRRRAGAILLVLGACGRGNFDGRVDATTPGGDTASDSATDAVSVDASTPVALIGDLADDFSDGVLASFWDNYNGTGTGTTQYSESNGQLVIMIGDSVEDTYAGYVTFSGHDMRNRAAVVHVLETSTVVGANCYMTFVQATGTGNFGLVASNSVLQATQNDIAFAQVAFVLANQSWWRVREQAGTLSFETSPDGQTWSAIGTQASPSYIADVKPNIGGGNYEIVTSPGQCKFDDFGRPPP